MKKISDPPVNRQGQLAVTSSTEIFNTVLSDLFRTKQELVKNLPLIGATIFSQDVKFLLLQSATIINGQIIRLGLARAILDIEFSDKPPVLNGCVNLLPHIKGSATSRSLENDAIVLIHLIVAEGIEVDAFRMLKKLAGKIRLKAIVDLMAECHRESLATKRSLEAKLEFVLL